MVRLAMFGVEGKRSASGVSWVAPREVPIHMQSARGRTSAPVRGGRPMKERITSFVGLDTHIDSIAIGVAPIGRQEPHFIGTVPPQLGALSRALARLGKPEALQIVYE